MSPRSITSEHSGSRLGGENIFCWLADRLWLNIYPFSLQTFRQKSFQQFGDKKLLICNKIKVTYRFCQRINSTEASIDLYWSNLKSLQDTAAGPKWCTAWKHQTDWEWWSKVIEQESLNSQRNIKMNIYTFIFIFTVFVDQYKVERSGKVLLFCQISACAHLFLYISGCLYCLWTLRK